MQSIQSIDGGRAWILYTPRTSPRILGIAVSAISPTYRIEARTLHVHQTGRWASLGEMSGHGKQIPAVAGHIILRASVDVMSGGEVWTYWKTYCMKRRMPS